MEDGRGSSGIGSGKSIGMADDILLPAEAVESNRSRPISNAIGDKLNRPKTIRLRSRQRIGSVSGSCLDSYSQRRPLLVWLELAPISAK